MKNWPLFDMKLDVSLWHQRAARKLSRIPNAFEFVTQHDAISILAVECGFQVQSSRIDQRSHHVRLKPDSFFVCKRRKNQRAERRHATPLQGSNDFQTCNDAI